MTPCLPTTGTRDLTCRNTTAATRLKLISIAVIFLTSVAGISSPVALARLFHGKPLYSKAILVIKCFAAGVILSTALVHVLPDAFDALSHCLVSTRHPWKDFPFAGFVTLLGALIALLVDLAASDHNHHHQTTPSYTPIDGSHQSTKTTLFGGKSNPKAAQCVPYSEIDDGTQVEKESTKATRFGGKPDPKAAAGVPYSEIDDGTQVEKESTKTTRLEEGEEGRREKERRVAKVMEIGIVFHSVIIGVAMGMSQNKCTLKPLVAALAFHQIFEGFGLGGCIAQAGFRFATTAYMGFMFSVTTPVGIVLGMLVFAVTGYDNNSANALIMEGLLGSLSSGILIYMAMVDLISSDFFHNSLMSSEENMKKACYLALALGSVSMSILAIWA